MKRYLRIAYFSQLLCADKTSMTNGFQVANIITFFCSFGVFFEISKVLYVLGRYKVKITFSAINNQNKGMPFVALLIIIL